MVRRPALAFAVLAQLVPTAWADAANITPRADESTAVISRNHSGKDRWWKLDGGDTNETAAGPRFCITPYLQRPATNAMTVLFFTDRACAATVTAWLKNGTAAPTAARPLVCETQGAWAQALTNNVAIGAAYDDSVWSNSLYRHRARFEGLLPNRIYTYVADLGSAAYTNEFRTAPDRNTPVRFVSYADCETMADPWANYVRNLKQMKTRDPDFFALAGDLTARGGIQSHWDGFWKANAGTETDVAGAIPILTAIGNHDLFDNSQPGDKVSNCWMYDMQGEPSTERFLSYFEVESNGVDFASAPAPDRETRDLSPLFHRVDYGPVTLLFIDTNNGRDGDTDDDHDHDTNYEIGDDSNHLKGGLDRRKGCRHPDFNVGTPQYAWLTNNLADAQAKARFTFVLNHHCPYSQGSHNRDWRTGEDGSALALRFLAETFVRYGVDGWICGHDEILEHSITNGWEILPDGQRRRHTLSIYDLGCSGDTFRNSNSATNPLKYYTMTTTGYGFLETDVTTNANGRWTCTITPINASGSSCTAYPDQIVIEENPSRGENENDVVYTQHRDGNTLTKSYAAEISATKPASWLAWEKPPEGPGSESPETFETLAHPALVPYTQVTRAAGVAAAERVGRCFTNGDEVCYSLLSERGRDYALGQDGQPAGAWVTGDGTPLLLRAPKRDEGDYRVLVKETE